MNVAHVGRYVRSPRVAGWKKALGVLAVVYAVLPIDLVPDVVPIFGWLDDVGVLAAAFTFIARDMSQHAKREAAEAKVIDGEARVLDEKR